VFAAGVVLTLSIGIGSSIAIFAIIDGVLLRPLPFPQEDRLMVIGELRRGATTPGTVCYRTFAEIRDQSKSFESVALARDWTPSLESQQNAEVIAGNRVSHSYFDVIGVQSVRGRFFRPEEDQPGPNVVVIGHGLGVRRFGGDPDIVGKPIRLEGQRFEIIGVAPEAGNHPRAAWQDISTTLQIDDAKERTNIGRNSNLFGRLQGGSSTDQANAEMAALMRQHASTYPETHNPKDSAAVVNLREIMGGATRPTLLTLFGAVSLVLLASCANASNLLLNRASARRQELAVRAALGASRVRLALDLLSETVLLAAGGALVGAVLALAIVRVLIAFNAAALPRLDAVTLDVRTCSLRWESRC
jgi:predicted permease